MGLNSEWLARVQAFGSCRDRKNIWIGSTEGYTSIGASALGLMLHPRFGYGLDENLNWRQRDAGASSNRSIERG